MMYDQREKAQRDQQWLLEGTLQEGIEKGREGGREEGREEGKVVGTITTIQGILGETITDEVELKKLDATELNRLCANLQERLRTRGS